MLLRNCKLQICFLAVLAPVGLGGGLLRAQESEPASPAAKYETVTVQGRVVWLAEAMERRYGVTTGPEAEKYVQVLETPEGHLLPLVEDVRGRSFRKDDRLRAMEVELLARRYEGAAFLQVIRIFEIKDGSKLEIDYWCDICSIAMYELKPCDCCQGEIELRRREVK
jgi:hypothetical protein